ncbi:hypothetical protein L6R53_15610, partial [Myxococcota bacterium]|nr:hypothetical protein [Myxococcota bacterium]
AAAPHAAPGSAAPPAAPGPTAPPAAPGPAAPPAAPAGAHGLRLRMDQRFERLTQARDALIQGRPEQARAHLATLAADPPDPELPPDWGTWMDGMQQDARAGAASADAGGLARAVASAANQCGGCHQSLGLVVALPHPGPAPSAVSGPTPSGDPGVAAHMAGHQWAADRMWAALVQPSDTAWAESLQVLSQPALDTLALEVGAQEAEEVAASAYAVHELAAGGLRDPDPATRADLYGQVLAACVACHARRP